ncbi:hypothetical protein BO70DRAFT_348539 [Aspergillus heteromorphus CBS 117.55]|uniref:Uncharacterized protein n=1 Tax=Aspergillus heteromorphus CBS 117.55 TaxID=1448321 RepID=A0A317X6C0_9EURO|nr:uncharacterized protein BO70DRAFT_348539 [Aspergillus heteromorphus CBS 117.55]PWY92110.1 hypothetical protein BO70DRAFT_348539 [Aspergillus heteromorphus CBS 117.55]
MCPYATILPLRLGILWLALSITGRTSWRRLPLDFLAFFKAGSRLSHVGTEIQGRLLQNCPSYTPQNWHGTLLVFAALFLPLLINIFARRLLAPVEVLSGVIHILSYPAIMVVMVVLGQRHTNEFVWTEFVTDQSEWHKKGVIFSIGLLTAAFTLSSFDGVIHMSEEVNNAPRAVSRAMVWGMVLNLDMLKVIIWVKKAAIDRKKWQGHGF